MHIPVFNATCSPTRFSNRKPLPTASSTYPIADTPKNLSAGIAGNGWEDASGEKLWSSTIVFINILRL